VSVFFVALLYEIATGATIATATAAISNFFMIYSID
jgi:hypothetical protein